MKYNQYRPKEVDRNGNPDAKVGYDGKKIKQKSKVAYKGTVDHSSSPLKDHMGNGSYTYRKIPGAL